MPRLTVSNPAYRKHRASGQAVVTVNGRDVYLGPHGTAASRRAYDRQIAEWLAAGRGSQGGGGTNASDVSVNEVLAAFLKHANAYHGGDDVHGGELASYKLVLRLLKRLYGPTPAADFGPLALKACRGEMVRAGWSRRYVNGQVGRVKRLFKWAVGEELVAGGVLHGLQAIGGLRAGKSDARETEKVRPADPALVDAVLAIVPPPVAGLIRVQLASGCRPGEACALRSADVDRSADVWVYRPVKHKTQSRGHDRAVYLSADCQAVLLPFMDREPTAHLFSPAEAMAWTRAKRTDDRKTDARWGNRPGTHVARRPKRTPGGRYTVTSYGVAVMRACAKAFPPPGELARRPKETAAAWSARLSDDQRAELKAWRKAHHWHPNQLRHTAGTRFRKDYGVETARVLLGHSRLSTTEIYAERDEAAAVDAIKGDGGGAAAGV